MYVCELGWGTVCAKAHLAHAGNACADKRPSAESGDCRTRPHPQKPRFLYVHTCSCVLRIGYVGKGCCGVGECLGVLHLMVEPYPSFTSSLCMCSFSFFCLFFECIF